MAKLASDDPTGAPVPDVSLVTDPNILAALLDATGMFESAVMMGARYSADDLQAIKATDCGARGLMFRIIADFSWQFLFERRPNTNVPPPPTMQRSIQWLDLLSQGKRIFAFVETQKATVMEKVDATPQDIEDRNGMVVQAEDYYGTRSDRAWSR